MEFFKKNKLHFTIFIFFFSLVLLFYKDLFFSYFEAEEWFHFTYYLPLTKKPDGFLTAIIYNFIHTSALSAGQHVTPIASLIFFLNTKLFGLQYEPYAFMSLLFHAINSFLIFLLLKIYLPDKQQRKSTFFALTGGIFFALFPTALHVWTGAAPFYGENIISVTFVLLFLITLKIAYINKNKKYIYLSFIWFLCALFSKETSGYLFLLFPLLVFFEKRIFSLKFIYGIFLAIVIFYTIVRFIVPNYPYLQAKVSHKFFNGPVPQATLQLEKHVDTNTIVSRDTSIHKNLPAEVVFRAITFPVRMMGTVFIPRQTVQSISQVIAPIFVPLPSGGDLTSQASFANLAGNFLIIYLTGIGIFIFYIKRLKKLINEKKRDEAYVLSLGVAIVVLAALPLVVIIFLFPRWGYDTYFDSRHYYHPGTGAAILFPFLLFGFSRRISNLLHIKSSLVVTMIIFFVWFVLNMQAVFITFNQFVNRYNSERREVVKQLKTYMPHLSKKTVFHIETDEKSAYGPILPFQSSVPQALSLIYYDSDPLPDNFFNKIILDAKPEGYQYEDGRGFGYYISKKSLANALLEKKFSVDDVYSYYYEAEKVKLHDRTAATRDEMKKYIDSSKEFATWDTYVATASATEKVTFSYPPFTEIIDNPIATTETKMLKDILINNPQLTASVKIIRVLPAIDVNEVMGVFGKINNAELPTAKKVSFDSYTFNDAYVSIIDNEIYYVLKFEDLLITIVTPNSDDSSVAMLEKILGSIKIIK